MALERFQRTPVNAGSRARSGYLPPPRTSPVRTRRNRRVWPAAVALLVFALIGGEIALATSTASLGADPTALAGIGMPLGGGTIEQVTVTGGPGNAAIPVQVKGSRIWPQRPIAAGQLVTIDVVVKRPGLISWLTGGTQRVQVRLRTPIASLRSRYLILPSGLPVAVGFSQPVRMLRYGHPGAMRRRVLSFPQSTIDLPRTAQAGSELVVGVPRRWESTPHGTAVSWFPAGAPGAVAVANPAPGSRIAPGAPITLTFSQPVSRVLGDRLPPVGPNASGSWQRTSSHTITFRPAGYGYGLGTTVRVQLPSGVKLVGAGGGGSGSVATWPVAAGSTLRLQQILAQLGYLPVTWVPGGSGPVSNTPATQEAAALHPPTGRFSWLYPHIPPSLRAMWSPGAYGSVTKGALMAFQYDHGLATDGIPGPTVWHALIAAAIADKRSTFGYTYVMVDKAAQTLKLSHDGLTLLRTAVNTGIASSATASGTFQVYEHIASGTMSGTNPDGSHYNDPNVPWISYFNGGDALHGFYRAQYGYPQSLGCVEMSPNTAQAVWKYTPIGTLVNVA